MKKEATQERSKRTVQIVLEAALQVLIEHGYEKAATNRIAERSGFGVGTLYQYFEDKEDIYRELVDRELQRLIDVLENPALQSTLAESLSLIIAAASQTTKEHPGTYRALEPLLAGPFQASREAARARAGNAMADILKHHRDEITVDDLDVAGHFSIAIAEGVATCANPDHLGDGALEQQTLSLIMAALTTS